MNFSPLPNANADATNPATHPVVTQELRERLTAKTLAAAALLERIASDYAPVAFASSFGAEDMLLTDMILRQRLPIAIFTLDTGRLPPETLALVGEAEKHYQTRFAVYSPDREALEEYVRQHGVNAFYESVELRQKCCRIRKVEPLARALSGFRAWVTGLRRSQSQTRQNLALREHDAERDMEKFNPLLEWSEAEVWAYLRENRVPYNPLHDRFYPSIGCAPCTRALSVGEELRAGRWWWENPEKRECGLHTDKKRV